MVYRSCSFVSVLASLANFDAIVPQKSRKGGVMRVSLTALLASGWRLVATHTVSTLMGRVYNVFGRQTRHSLGRAGSEEELYFLGDFSTGGPKVALTYRQRIRCKRICFALGTHDRMNRKLEDQFFWVKGIAEINIR
jgi:hypothetical protein